MEPDSLVLLEVADGVAVLTLNRPAARNALSPELIAQLQQMCADCDARDDVSAMVLTGADPAFCGGIDLKRLAAGTSNAVGLLGQGPFPLIANRSSAPSTVQQSQVASNSRSPVTS